MRLSNGKDREPIMIKAPAKPVFVEMYFQRGNYYFSLVYKVEPPPRQITGNIVAVDMGEIHPIVSHDGLNTIIYNGRRLRSIKQYREKTKARFQSKMAKCTQRSNRWHRLRRSKNRALAKLDAQLKDAEHKITSRFVSDCQKAKADTIVIGDIKGIRARAQFSKKSNQKIHQWAFARIESLIEYKAELAGIKVVFEDESYTSQTCPNCGHRNKPTTRNYHCQTVWLQVSSRWRWRNQLMEQSIGVVVCAQFVCPSVFGPSRSWHYGVAHRCTVPLALVQVSVAFTYVKA